MRGWRARLARTRLAAVVGDGHEDDRLSAFLDDELSERQALEVTRHVVDCPRCAAELEAIRCSREALRALPRVEPPSELYTSVSARLRDLAPTEGGRGRRVAVALLASAVVVGGAVALAGGDEPGTVAPDVEVLVVDHVARTEGGPVISPVDLGR